MSNVKQKITFYLITVVAIILFSVMGYAYFSMSISNTNNEKIMAGTATLALVFEDNDNGVSGTLNLGKSVTKKFTIENTGTVDTYAKINWYNLVNTYTGDSLTWTLEQSTSENGTYTHLGSGKVPVSSVQTTKTLKNGILVPVNTTYYYKLTITLNDLDVNQNSDIFASFYSYFNLEEGSPLGTDKIINLVSGSSTSTTDIITRDAPTGATCTNTFSYDGTVDNNLRYVGANPCNYVTFNGEESGWRIVGVMNNVDDGTGNLETRIKLIRVASLGGYSWDSSSTGVDGAKSNYGINDWSQADLMRELNGDYMDMTLLQNPTNWYNGSNSQKTGVFDISNRLGTIAQGQIGDAKWFLGGHNTTVATASTFYTKERGNVVWGSEEGQTCNDKYCPRSTEWTGKVALIYPSDYGFAVGGSVRSTCLSRNLDEYNSNDCYTNDWLKLSSTYSWLLSPHSSYFNRAFLVVSTGITFSTYTFNTFDVLPTVYLKSEVTITHGAGTETDPYQIS